MAATQHAQSAAEGAGHEADAEPTRFAIIGYAARLPGAADADEYWDVLRDGRDAVSEIPQDRWDVEEFFNQDAGAPGKIVTRRSKLFRNDHAAEETFIYIKEHNMYLVFVKDISDDEKRQEELAQLRAHTIDTAQQVIDKQMRVAQEIASLLGETTAETKVALTNLKKSMAGPESADRK